MNPWMNRSTGVCKPVTFRDEKHKIEFEEGCTLIFPKSGNIWEEQTRFASGDAVFLLEVGTLHEYNRDLVW
jgi:hypothetical protein